MYKYIYQTSVICVVCDVLRVYVCFQARTLVPLVRYQYNEGVRVAAIAALPALLQVITLE